MGLFTKEPMSSDLKQDHEHKDTYESGHECDNCGEYIDLVIAKGRTIKEHLKDTICIECGCKMLE